MGLGRDEKSWLGERNEVKKAFSQGVKPMQRL
jgi:hypothetical protein